MEPLPEFQNELPVYISEVEQNTRQQPVTLGEVTVAIFFGVSAVKFGMDINGGFLNPAALLLSSISGSYVWIKLKDS